MKIIIVGGGTAGWISALMISKIFKGVHSVTLIESSSLGIIGAGESSTGALRRIVNNEEWDFGCNQLDFFNEADATPKLAVLYKNWKGDNSEYLAPIDSAIEDKYIGTNPLLNSYVANGIPIEYSSLFGRMASSNITPFHIENNELFGLNNHAFNFDAKLAADYFEKVCGSDVIKIDAIVQDINFKENGCVNDILLDNGKTIDGDFFIDATGFGRLFPNKMGVKYLEYPELTLNSALPFLLPHTEETPKLLTTAWAQKFGWMWQIPTRSRFGCGYVYDSNFIDADQAQQEIENILKTEIEPIKNIKFRPGRLETAWNKNVLSVGLSVNFFEPLEATSIHGTILLLNMFVLNYLKEDLERTITDKNISKFNNSIAEMYDNYKTFILLHYATGRNDTEFWRNANSLAVNDPIVAEILEISKTRLLNQTDLANFYGTVGAELHNWILCSLGHYTKETAKKEEYLVNRRNAARQKETEICDQLSKYNWLTNKQILDYLLKLKYEVL
jgi:tryptophan 6-halogenase